MSKSNRQGGRVKARKPRPDFPLFPHQAGYWAKKIRGKLIYFGKVADDPKGVQALEKWLAEKDALLAGRTPRIDGKGLAVGDLCNHFLSAKLRRLENGELSPRTFHDYKGVTDILVSVFGKTRLVTDLASDDFEHLRQHVAKRRGPVALGNFVARTRTVFKYGFDAGLLDKPLRFGPGFTKPSKKVVRQARQRNGSKMFEPSEIRTLLEKADTQLRAMILLGVNCGYGNTDCGNLPISALDLENGWTTFPRPKTAIERKSPLWSETVQALREVLDSRPTPTDPADLDKVFVTKFGQAWAKVGDRDRSGSANPISAEFRKLCQACELYKKGRGFYALRHVFQTVGEEAGETATRFLMGHTDATMSGVYRERISDDRLRAVARYVHGWLWPQAAEGDESQQLRVVG